MNDRGREDTWSDALLEQELSRALTVEPSPAFLPRVRSAVAAAPAPARWQLSLVWSVGASAAAMVVVVVLMRVAAPQRPNVPAPPPTAAVPLMPPTVAPALRLPATAGVPDRRPPASDTARVRTRPLEPELLIPAEEAAALKRLMRGLPQGVLVSPASETPLDEVAVVQPPNAIVVAPMPAIPPVTVEPIEVETGALQ